MYQEQDFSSQVIKSVQAINITQPTDFFNRISAVKSFDETSESSDLAEANKRVANILGKSDFNASITTINSSFKQPNT